MKIGAEEGFGKGFLSGSLRLLGFGIANCVQTQLTPILDAAFSCSSVGSLMNWRAVINVVGPMLFGTVYNFGSKNKFPGLVFLVGAMTVLAAETTLQSLPAKIFDDAEKERIAVAGGAKPKAT